MSPLQDRLQELETVDIGATYCSQCGREFGPGDGGYSYCDQHPGVARARRQRRGPAALAGWATRRSKRPVNII